MRICWTKMQENRSFCTKKALIRQFCPPVFVKSAFLLFQTILDKISLPFFEITTKLTNSVISKIPIYMKKAAHLTNPYISPTLRFSGSNKSQKGCAKVILSQYPKILSLKSIKQDQGTGLR